MVGCIRGIENMVLQQREAMILSTKHQPPVWLRCNPTAQGASFSVLDRSKVAFSAASPFTAPARPDILDLLEEVPAALAGQ